MNIKTETKQTETHDDFAFGSNYLSLCFNDEKIYLFSHLFCIILFSKDFCLFQTVSHYVDKSGLELVAISLHLEY